MSENKKPTCVGTGLIALDMVVNGDHREFPRFWAGGSCGNVLMILAYLGWHSYPIARFGNDLAAETIVKDFHRHQVKVQFIYFDTLVQTPIILHKILISPDGNPTHRFYWICPNCGNWFPRYKPVLLKNVLGFENEVPKMNCFYFDRVSAAALHLAEKARSQGALIVFEPTSIKEDKQFNKAISACDILKYSNERAKDFDKLTHESPAQLVIETLGAEGLRYRLRRNGEYGDWKLIPSFHVANLKDTAGAGDWCTAGMVDMLFREGKTSLKNISEKKIVSALRYGQALSALNCAFEGARGVMYGLDKKPFDKKVREILDRKEANSPIYDTLSAKVKKMAQCVCPACQAIANKKKRQKS